MKKGVLIILLLVILGLIALGIIGITLTGYASWDPNLEGIFRAVPIKNSTTNTTDVHLRIASTENVIAIQEILSPADCKVLSYSLNKDIDIFEFNENENTWIFANDSDFLDVELSYQIPYDCSVTSGKYYTVDSFSENDSSLSINESNLTYSASSASSSSSNENSASSSSGGHLLQPSATKISTNEITQSTSNEEYIAQSLSATENMARIQEDFQSSDKYSSYLMIILAVIAIGIIGFIVFSLLKSPKGS